MSDYKGLVFTLRSMRNEVCNTAAEKIERQSIALEAMAGEVASLQNTFDLMWNADQRAIKLWQEATGKDHIWPDKAKTTLWLLERLEAAEAERDRLKAALETIAHDNVPREVFIVWRTDGSNSKHDKCQHMRMMYEDCGNCTALFARKALGDAS